MKKIFLTAMICAAIFSILSVSGVFAADGAPGEFTDEMIEQMTEMYLNMDIDATIKMMSEAGQIMDADTIETMRNMQKMAREGTLGDFLRGVGTSDEAAEKTGFTAAKIDVSAPAAGEVLAIAKKYYGYHSAALNGSLKGEFTRDAGSVAFDGKANDIARAESLCTNAGVVAMFNGDGDYAVATAAAAVGWAPGYARGTGTLAAMLVKAGFITDSDRLNDAVKLAAYAISIDKNDADFHITLGWALFDLNDLDGALEAVEAALAIEPGNSAALNLKIEILNKKGGTFLSAAASKIGDKLKENDGELSKRLTKQEKATEGMTEAKDGDSKEEILRKFNQFCELEPITPADMMEPVFPTEARQIRKQVNTVSDSDKAMLNNSIRPLPNGLYRTARQVYEMRDEIKAYWDWDHEKQVERYNSVILPAAMAADAARQQRGTGSHYPHTPLDYMWDYNFRVLWNAKHAALRYLHKLSDEYHAASVESFDKLVRKNKEAWETYEAEKGIIGETAAKIKLKLACNEAEDICFKERMPLISKFYDESKRVSRQLWEKMLPFARATRHPEHRVLDLYVDSCNHIESAILWLANFGTGSYYPEVSLEDLQEAQEAAREALEQLMAHEQSLFEDVTNGFTISVAFGPVELKLSNTNVEIEAVELAAVRVAYDWKSKEVEIGVGVGVKAKLSAGTGMGVEAKYYNNFVIDVRNGEVTDVYLSAEVKGTIPTHEGGLEGRVSVMGKGASLSVASKRGLGPYMIEHKTELIKTGRVILEFNYRYGCTRSARAG